MSERTWRLGKGLPVSLLAVVAMRAKGSRVGRSGVEASAFVPCGESGTRRAARRLLGVLRRC